MDPRTRTTTAGEFASLDAIRSFVAPLATTLKVVERCCENDRWQWIVKDPATTAAAHYAAVVFEAIQEKATDADDVHSAVGR